MAMKDDASFCYANAFSRRKKANISRTLFLGPQNLPVGARKNIVVALECFDGGWACLRNYGDFLRGAG